MSQKQLFERKLTQLITDLNPHWLSKQACPIRLIVLTWFDVSRWRWQTEPDGMAEKRLQQQAEQEVGWQAIADEFDKQYQLRSVRRPSLQPGMFDLYILAYFGHWWVGIQTQIREG